MEPFFSAAPTPTEIVVGVGFRQKTLRPYHETGILAVRLALHQAAPGTPNQFTTISVYPMASYDFRELVDEMTFGLNIGVVWPATNSIDSPPQGWTVMCDGSHKASSGRSSNSASRTNMMRWKGMVPLTTSLSLPDQVL